MLARLKPLAKAEIPQFDLAIIEENILRLDVSMHNIESIQNLKRLQQLPEDSQSLFLREPSLLFERVHQRATIAVLVDKIVVIPCLEVVLILDDKLAGADGRQCLHFIDCALLEEIILLKLFDRDDFDRELAHLLGVQCAIDLAIIALAYLFDQRVVVYDLDHSY